MILPPELIGDIIVFLDKDVRALNSCALVCHAFHNAATPLLYKRIHVSPPKVGLAWQVVEDTLGRKPFAASRLPSHRAYVEEFTLDGYITKIRPSRQTPIPIIDRIPEALQLWQNLRTVTLAPQRATGPALLNIVKALRCCPSLRSVTVNEFAMDDNIMPDLAKLIGLRELTLLHPTRALFMVLCSWISRLESTLFSLHLLGNCGSLTPGILRVITPHLSNIQSLALGLSYALADTDIFACLSQLSQLKSLRLQYYRQLRTLPSGLMLPALRHFTVAHTSLSCKEDAIALSTWIRRISAASPLETLQTISSDDSGPSLCFDGLISHIASQHRHTLLAIQMPKAYVRGFALRTLLRKCTALQCCSLTVAFSTLVSDIDYDTVADLKRVYFVNQQKAFPTMTDVCAELNTVTFGICDHQQLVIEKKDAQKLLQRVPQLRYVTVNGVSWKRDWLVPRNEEGSMTQEFVAILTNVIQDLPFEDT